MQPSPPKTPFEERATDAFRILSDLRIQSGMMTRGLAFCLDRCLDTEELYTLFRSKNAPIGYRLQKDMEEKKCVQNCGAKWDALLPQIVTEVNERTITEVQASTLSKLLAQQQQQQQQQ
eukprot:gene4475-3268_t